MDFDDEDLEIKQSNNNNNYDDSNPMQDLPTVRPGTAPRNPLGRQNSGLYFIDLKQRQNFLSTKSHI